MAITVRNLTKFYGSEKAVDEVSFDVKTARNIGFFGPKRCGEDNNDENDNLLHASYIRVHRSGRVRCRRAFIRSQKKIGYLPELNPLYLDMNVIEYLEYSALLHGIRNGLLQGRMREMIEVCGLGDARHKDIGELSKGFRQRVGLAQAMIHDPEVLILDEPTNGLDPNQIVEIRNLIRQLGRAKTVVLSTHILSEVQATCDRVVIIHQGKIAADGTLDQLQEKFHGSEMIYLEIKAHVVNPMIDIYPNCMQFPQ